MRPKERIPVIIDLLTKIWVDHPDMRLMQLLGNCLPPGDHYHLEDNKLEDLLRERYDIDVS